MANYVAGTKLVNKNNVKDSENHNTWHMSGENAGWYEPQRLNTFEFVATGLDNIVMQGTENTKVRTMLGPVSSASHPEQEALRLSVNQANIPSFSQNPLEVSRGNTTLRYAGKPTFDSGSIQVQDYIGMATLEVLYGWQALSFNILTEKVGVAADYKKTCYLMEYTPDYQLVRRWKLIGCWVSAVNEGAFDHAQDGLHQVTATIQYDRALIDRDDA